MNAPLSAEPTVCTVSTLAPITWTPDSNDTPLSATPVTADRRQKVQFTTADNKPAHMEILYGSTLRSSNIVLTERNAPEGVPNIQYPEAPGLRVNNGWAFVTFRWPLIWMESIDAGSIGTTALLHNQAAQADVYLISNDLDTVSPAPPVRPAGVTDPDVHLFVRVDGTPGGTGVKIPAGFQAVRRSYRLERDTQGKVTKVTFIEQKTLAVHKNDAGQIQVAEDKFLQKVLDCASLQGLYTLPAGG